jgi:hypothetical protein
MFTAQRIIMKVGTAFYAIIKWLACERKGTEEDDAI